MHPNRTIFNCASVSIVPSYVGLVGPGIGIAEIGLGSLGRGISKEFEPSENQTNTFSKTATVSFS
jgi:hypothetical protein